MYHPHFHLKTHTIICILYISRNFYFEYETTFVFITKFPYIMLILMLFFECIQSICGHHL